MATTLFETQLAFLNKEIDLLDSSIRQMDEITKDVKQWAIVTWTATVGLCLKEEDLQTATPSIPSVRGPQ